MCRISNYVNYRALSREKRLNIAKIIFALIVMALVVIIIILLCRESYNKCEGIFGDTVHLKLRKHPNFGKFDVGRCSENYVPKDIDNEDSKLSYIARLVYKNESKLIVGCHGSLIADDLVLTAAHCLNQSDGFILSEIHLGGTKEKNFEDTIKVTRFKIIIHEKYNEEKMTNDIGLVKFDTAIKLTQNINIICIPFHESKVPGDLKIVEYNDDNEVDHPSFSENIISEEVELIECSEKYFGHFEAKLKKLNESSNEIKINNFKQITSNQFCAGEKPVKKGNSGMPIKQRNQKTGSPIIYGLVSYGLRGNEDIPTVYTQIHRYRHWILCKA